MCVCVCVLNNIFNIILLKGNKGRINKKPLKEVALIPGGSQHITTPAPGDLMPSSDLHGHHSQDTHN